uniref:Uncharacterized protein n=1 Tax=viral metagenome TaxID=1070528 RepID=A0A6M3LRM2_9ZZZZ
MKYNVPNVSAVKWYRRWQYSNSKLLCYVGIHLWRYNNNGYTLEEWEECERCGKYK